MCSCLCFNRHVSGCCNTVNLPTVEQMKVFLFRFLLQSCQRIACLGNNEELGGWLCGFIIPQVWAIAPKHKPPPHHFPTEPERTLSFNTADVDSDNIPKWKNHHQKPAKQERRIRGNVWSSNRTLNRRQKQEFRLSLEIVVGIKRQTRHCGVYSQKQWLIGVQLVSWQPQTRNHKYILFQRMCCWTCCSVSVMMGCQKSLCIDEVFSLQACWPASVRTSVIRFTLYAKLTGFFKHSI